MRQTQNLLIAVVADRILDLAEFLLIRSSFLFIVIALSSAAFYRVLASVCEAKLRLCVKKAVFFLISVFVVCALRVKGKKTKLLANY